MYYSLSLLDSNAMRHDCQREKFNLFAPDTRFIQDIAIKKINY